MGKDLSFYQICEELFFDPPSRSAFCFGLTTDEVGFGFGVAVGGGGVTPGGTGVAVGAGVGVAVGFGLGVAVGSSPPQATSIRPAIRPNTLITARFRILLDMGAIPPMVFRTHLSDDLKRP